MAWSFLAASRGPPFSSPGTWGWSWLGASHSLYTVSKATPRSLVADQCQGRV